MSLTIHGIVASRAVRPLWAAAELGLPFEHLPTPYKDGATRTPEFLALNPNGHIPVLLDHRPDGDVVVWESMACALYLADNYKGPEGLNLAAQTKAESAEILRWTFWVVTECEKDALTILMHTLLMPADRRKPELAAEAARRLTGPLRVIEQHLAGQIQALLGAGGDDHLAGLAAYRAGFAHIVHHRLVTVARHNAFAHGKPQVAADGGAGIVDGFALTDRTAQVLGNLARAGLKGGIRQHLVRLHGKGGAGQQGKG